MDDAFAKLEAEFCPPIDPALLSAIVSDFDLEIPEEYEAARSTLDTLKESALAEELSAFDASGTGAQGEGNAGNNDALSWPDTSPSSSKETDLTSLSHDFTYLDLQSSPRGDVPIVSLNDQEEIENLEESAKTDLLVEVLENRVSRTTAQHVLRKRDGRWHAAMEELLNHVYFNDSRTMTDGDLFTPKGIDAFSEENIVSRRKKERTRKKNRSSAEGSSLDSHGQTAANDPVPLENRWQNSAKDIDFIASRTNLPAPMITSCYHKNGASLQRTIRALLITPPQEYKLSTDCNSATASEADDLVAEFPGITLQEAKTLVSLTHPSAVAAHDLAKAVTTTGHSSSRSGLEIVPNYTHLHDNITDDQEEISYDPLDLQSRRSLYGLSEAERAKAFAIARNTAFSQAQAAHRKAKSNHLMGGAAAYYSQVGRDLTAMSMKATAEAADKLVQAQSDSLELDLHGVDVVNAVRITAIKVQGWWDGLGEDRVNGRTGHQTRQMGYRIVVGRGTHSEGGKGKLGPAVSKMLRDRGWNFELAGAVIVVKGRAKR